jgi:alpha-L-rhamnosidase
MGATTIWERWDSLLPDGSINPGEMTSFNHYAFGAVADWMHRTLGGLACLEPGFHSFRIHPHPAKGLTHANVRHMTPYGIAECSWRIRKGMFALDVTIPPNTTAQVILPGQDNQPVEVGSGKYQWKTPFDTQI